MKTVVLALLTAAFGIACAAPNATGTTTTTAADVPIAEEKASPAPALEDPPGQLSCRSKSSTEGTIELFVDGSKGTLRRTAPSGNVSTQNVQVERLNGTVIADERGSTDLAVHAATVREHEGKRYIRLGDWNQAWSRCE